MKPVALPLHLKNLKCENCGFIVAAWEWLDEETSRLLDQKAHGLLPEGSISQDIINMVNKEIEILKESRDADRKEMRLIRQTLDDLIQNKVKEIKNEAADRGQDLATLTERVKGLEDWKKFTEENK